MSFGGTNRKMIYEVGKDTKYYLAAANSKKEFKEIIFWKGYYFYDILLKGRTFYWLFGKEFNFTISEFKEKVYFHQRYTYEQFKADVEELGNPKFIVLYVEQIHGCDRPKTKEELEEERKRKNTIDTVMAACNSGAY